MRFQWNVAVALGLLCFAGVAQAYVLPLSPSLTMEILSESVPTAYFPPSGFSTADYTVEWAGKAVPDVVAAIEADSLQWVRVSEVLVLPRARLVVTAKGVTGGRVLSAGFAQPLVVTDGDGEARAPIALVSGERNLVPLTVVRGGRELQGELRIRYSPKSGAPGPRLFYDPSCSRYGVRAETAELGPDSWAYIGCRMVQVEGPGHRTSSLELLLFWDNIGQTIEIGGASTEAAPISVWPLRLRAQPGSVVASRGERRIALHYQTPHHLTRGSIGLGVGPYGFSFRSPDESVNSVTVMPTLYLSYFLTEAMRFVAFSATTLNSQFITDFGMYFSTEYLRNIDRRVSVNLLLGVHSIGFRSGGQYFFKIGAPQGAEMIVTDFFGRARNLSVGGFLYPKIQGKSYYNTWIRWGSPRLFGEFNYIAWDETINGSEFSAKSAGVTLGFPLSFLGFL